MEKYVRLIRDQGGEIVSHEVWGRRKFSYEINKKTEGSYVYVRFRANNKIIDELNRVLRFDENVLRTLIVLDEEAEARNAAARRQTVAEAGESAGAAHQEV
jgi:small subunit ribosomal protein S6